MQFMLLNKFHLSFNSEQGKLRWKISIQHWRPASLRLIDVAKNMSP